MPPLAEECTQIWIAISQHHHYKHNSSSIMADKIFMIELSNGDKNNFTVCTYGIKAFTDLTILSCSKVLAWIWWAFHWRCHKSVWSLEAFCPWKRCPLLRQCCSSVILWCVNLNFWVTFTSFGLIYFRITHDSQTQLCLLDTQISIEKCSYRTIPGVFLIFL